jgi:NADPH-dependent glutamate synthase beta subunit-like oxidoreductase/glutamate synthase domain-containing protein 3/Pyruvate/2-oxoacid:ferredoxin oxidoreductase delta subunit
MSEKIIEIKGTINGERVPSKDLEFQIQKSVKDGYTYLKIYANGQHGIGGRIWPKPEPVKIEVFGAPGQRLGSMGMFGTEIVVHGSCSDDVGWINCGATITVLGDVTNGAHNAGAQGKLYVQGSGGARCDTMTKRNPRFKPLESWYFKDVGDSFAEFKAGGIAVVCGVEPRNPENILGYRPCVGMVGGKIYFRGNAYGFSENDVRVESLNEEDWKWLTENMKDYLRAIDRESYYEELTKDINLWKKVVPLTPAERAARHKAPMPMKLFKSNIWEEEVGKGGIFGDLIEIDETILPFIVSGEERRRIPKWENNKFNAPCAFNCPTGIPTQTRTWLLRNGDEEEALKLVLEYSPFPGSVCGYVCPNPCMDACSRGIHLKEPVDIAYLGRLSLDLPAPEIKEKKNKKVAIIGGGPAGMAAAWRLAIEGYNVTLYEREEELGGKIFQCIPKNRLPENILKKEIERFRSLGIEIKTGVKVDTELFKTIYSENEKVILATGAHAPRVIPFEGYEDVIPGIVFLKGINIGTPMDLTGKKVVVIGAGNVGMDICCEAYDLGAEKVIAVDIQKPLSFGKEQQLAKEKGTEILYPKFTSKYDKKEGKIYFKDGSFLEADEVFISIGETPELDFIPENMLETERGYIKVNERCETSDGKILAVGDVTAQGLITDALGKGRKAAYYVHAQLSGIEFSWDSRDVVDYDRIKHQYYERDKNPGASPDDEANRCMSCGTCRDCMICEQTCFQNAITRVEHEDGSYEYVVDDELCIGCGFCAAVCPCGIWNMYDN